MTVIELILYEVNQEQGYKAVGVRTGWEHASRTVFLGAPFMKLRNQEKILLLYCMMSKWYNNTSLYRRKKLVFVRGWE